MTAETHVWLTERIGRIADNVVALDRTLAARPGDSLVRTERRTARNQLRAELATRVYAEHPDWPYRQQYYLYTDRERQAMEQAEARLAEKTGAKA